MRMFACVAQSRTPADQRQRPSAALHAGFMQRWPGWSSTLPATEIPKENAMTVEKEIQHSLNDLIEIARDGAEFYTEAAGKVKSGELATLFTQMAGHKREIVQGLSAEVAATGGKPADSGTMVGSMRQMYGKVRAALGDTDYAYVAELEESEDRLLKAFKDTVSDADTPASARLAAERFMPRVQECHSIMRSYKHAMKH
jgi:uncharacterized protein (TIGR02284 family)